MRVLVACEYSGKVRDAFTKLGWEAWSCDLLASETEGNHYQGNVMEILQYGWDLMIGHPPCTYLTNSGVRWLYNDDKTKNEERWKLMEEGAAFFRELLNAPIEHILLENPIPHRYATELIGHKYDQKIQPWMFGHGETKATCFWLKNLPKLISTNLVKGRDQRIHKLGPSEDRWKLRSETYQGIADAIAEQYHKYFLLK